MQKIRYRVIWNRMKKLNKQGKALVQVEASLNGRKVYMTTRVYLRPEEWDKEHGQVSECHPNCKELNAYLFQFMHDLEKVELSIWKRGGIPTLQQLKDSVKKGTNIDISFDSFARQCVERSDRKKGSKDNIYNTLKVLKKFKPSYDWNDLTYAFLKEFEIYLKGKSNSINTIGKHMAHLRMLINEAIKEGYVTYNPFVKFSIKKEPGRHSFLTPDELSELENLNLKREKSRRILDAFLFCCYVGLRFSDFKSLTDDNIVYKEGVEWLVLKSQKTNVNLELPLYLLGGGKALELLKKYNGIENMVDIGCNAEVNRRLREIGEQAGIKKRITFHSSRHTCATTLVYDGVPITSVQKVLGHKKISTTQIYSEVHAQTLIKDLSVAFRM